MKIKELRKKLRKNPEFLKAEKEIQWDIAFNSGRAVFFILMQSGLTQMQLSKKSGIRQSVISRAENKGCQLTVLNKLAKAAGLKVEINIKKAKV